MITDSTTSNHHAAHALLRLCSLAKLLGQTSSVTVFKSLECTLQAVDYPGPCSSHCLKQATRTNDLSHTNRVLLPLLDIKLPKVGAVVVVVMVVVMLVVVGGGWWVVGCGWWVVGGLGGWVCVSGVSGEGWCLDHFVIVENPWLKKLYCCC